MAFIVSGRYSESDHINRYDNYTDYQIALNHNRKCYEVIISKYLMVCYL